MKYDNTSEYEAYRHGMELGLTTETVSIRTGESCPAHLSIRNTGTVPIRVPSGECAYHDADWYFVCEGDFLGPVRIQNSTERSAHLKQVSVNPDEKVEFPIDLGEYLTILGPGKHNIYLVYYSRSHQRHWPEYPDFEVTTPECEITVETSDGWEESRESVLAYINHPDIEKRLEAWNRIKVEPRKVYAEAEWYNVLSILSKGEFSDNPCSLVFEQYDREIHREDYTVTVQNGHVIFRYRWDEEDIGGDESLVIPEDEAVEFFGQFLERSPFGFTPLQKFGSAYEPQLTVSLNVPEEEGDTSVNSITAAMTGYGRSIAESTSIRTFELEYHPQTSAWYKKILDWKDRADLESEEDIFPE